MIDVEFKIDRKLREAVVILSDPDRPAVDAFAMRMTADELERFGKEIEEAAAKVRAALAS